MAPRSKPPTVPSSASEPVKLDKVGLYDLSQVKRTLDDEVISFLEDTGYSAVTWTTDAKIILGIVAIAAALYSHFNKQEFPQNYYIVLYCVMTYLICAGVISVIGAFVESHSIFMGKARRKAKAMGKVVAPTVKAFSNFPKQGESIYSLTLRTGSKKEGGANKEGERSEKMSYEKYFTSDGHFLTGVFRKDVAALFKSLDDGKKSQ